MEDIRDDLYRVHGDLASRITDVHQAVLEIGGHWTSSAHGASSQTPAPIPDTHRIPEDITARFETSSKASNPELVDLKFFPFYKGVDAFHRHFERSTTVFNLEETSTGDFFAERTPKPLQYLDLMKSAWIIEKIKEGDEWAEASSDRLSECYMNELAGKCLYELSRFTSEEPRKRLAKPAQRNISLLSQDEF